MDLGSGARPDVKAPVWKLHYNVEKICFHSFNLIVIGKHITFL